jgi:hypothetical protein
MPNIELKIEVDSKGAITNINATGTAFDKLQKETDQTTTSLQKNQKITETSSKSLIDMAKAAGALFLAWQGVRFFSESIGEATDSARSLQMLQNALDGAGGAYGRTAEDLRAYSGVMQQTFNIQNEVAESIQRTLIQQKLQPELLDRVTRASIAVNKSIGDGVVTQQSATDMAKKLAMALEHPDIALRGLREAGIVFSKDQKKVIDEMLKTGDAAKIQEAILGELEKRYANTSITGFVDAQQKLALAISDIKEAFGTGLLEGFEASGFFKSISDGLGSAEIQGAFQGLGKSIGDAIGQVAKTVTENWDSIVTFFRGLGSAISFVANAITTIISPIQDVVSYISDYAGGLDKVAIAAAVAFGTVKVAGYTQALITMGTTAVTWITTMTAGMTAVQVQMWAAMTASVALNTAMVALAAALPIVALVALAAEVSIIVGLMKDLGIQFDEIEARERDNAKTTSMAVDRFNKMADSIKLTSTQLRWMNIDFQGIEDTGIRYMRIMQAIQCGRYGEKMASDYAKWNEANKKIEQGTIKVKGGVDGLGGSIAKVNPFVAEYQKQLGFSSLSASDLSQKLGALVSVYNSQKEQIFASIPATEKLRIAAADLAKEYVSQGKSIPVAIQNISAAMDLATESQKKYKQSVDDTFYSVFGGVDAYEKLIKSMKDSTKEQGDLKDATDEYRKSLGLLNEDQLKPFQVKATALIDVFSKFKGEILSNVVMMKKMRDEVSSLSETFLDAGSEVPPEFQKIASEIDAANQKIIEMLQLMGQFNPIFSAMASAMKNTNSGMKQTSETTKKTTDSFEALIQATNTAVSSLEKMGLISSKTAGMISGLTGGLSAGIAGMNAWKNAGTGFTGVLEKISAGFSILSGAISVVGALFSWLKGKSGELKAVERDLKGLSGITRDWTKELEKAAKAIGGAGSAGRAMNAVFSEMVKTSQITVYNFDQWSERLRNIFSAYTQGFAGASETAENFGKGFDALLEKAISLGIEGGAATTGWVLMFEEMKKKGVVVTEILDYINESTKSGLDGYKKMLSSIDVSELQGEIDKLRSAIAFPNPENPIDTGMAILELEALNKKMEEAKKLQAVFGSAGIQVFDDMIAYEKKLAENKSLIDAVDGWEKALIGFTNVNRIETQKQMDDFTQTAKNEFEALTKAGFTQGEALKEMGPQLQRLYTLQQQFGWGVDATTQGLIDQAKAAGLVTENTKTEQQTMGEGFKGITEAIFLLVETLGGSVPDAMKKASAEMLNFQDTAANTPAMVFDAVIQDDVMAATKIELEETAKVATLAAGGMESDFLSFQSQIESVNQSVVDLRSNLESIQSLNISAGYGESSISPSLPILSSIEYSGKKSFDVNVKFTGETESQRDSSLAREFISSIKQGFDKVKFPDDYALVQILKRLAINNVGGYKTFMQEL